jgi:hypothetical protein
MQRNKNFIYHIDIILMSFVFLMFIVLPLIFTRENGRIAWVSVLKIWEDKVLLLPVFIINHWLLVPRLVLKKKYVTYMVMAFLLITLVTVSYYMHDETGKGTIRSRSPEIRELPGDRNEKTTGLPTPGPPRPIPPYAELLLFSLLVVAVDTGLSFTKHWHISDEDKVRLEKENIEAQLGMLRNQISPHFFMNTLNNIYSLIEADKERSKQAVMKLSKLMRYLLYENSNGKVMLSKEFDFIRNYVDLMKLRFADEVEIRLDIPATYADIEIPVLLFVSYLENAFKYGTTYQHRSLIEADFEIEDGYLIFSCRNRKNSYSGNVDAGGIGLQNSRQRLDLLYNNKYSLTIHETGKIYSVILKIPI